MNMIGSNALAMLQEQAEMTIAELALVKTIDAENCGHVKDMVDNALKLAKDIDESRKLAKQPHIDAGAAVDAAYNPLKTKVEEIARTVKQMVGAFVIAEKAKAEAAAAEAKRKADELAKQTAEADPFLQDEEAVASAHTEAAIAQNRAHAAQQVVSASGTGRASSLRTHRFAEVTDARAMVMHYHTHPDVLGAATKLANAAIRAAKGGPLVIPGVIIKEEQRLA